MKKTLLALAIAGAAVSAQADTKVYGHVSYEARDLDSETDADFKQGGFSQSRFGFNFSKKLGNGLTALALQEFGFASGERQQSTYKLDETLVDADLNDDGDKLDTSVATKVANDNQIITRRQAFGFSGEFGKVLLGQYNDVGDGVINADLAGTNIVNALSSNAFGAVGIGVNGFDPGRG
jgi:predicted porin